jgi:hypothetical protein
MNVNEDERGKAVILRKVPCLRAITEILCRRNHKHRMIEPSSSGRCNGAEMVCAICSVTAHMIFDAIEKEGSKR